MNIVPITKDEFDATSPYRGGVQSKEGGRVDP